MKRLLILVTLLSSVTYGMDMANMNWMAQLDLRQQASDSTATACTGTCSTSSQLFFAAGATTKFDMGNNFGLRTGGMLTQRGYKQTTAGVSDAVNYLFVDVPVLPEYQINDMFSAHAGVVVGLKASRTCNLSSGTCDSYSDKSMVTPLQVGGTYNIDKQWTARLTYETGSTLTTTPDSDLKAANSVALGGGYSF